MLKVGMVSSIRPETNYTAYLIEALQRQADQADVYTYCEKDEENLKVPLKNLRPCWNRDWRYFFQILKQARVDRLNRLHFQHEINMYGGPRTAALFPFLVLAARLLGFRPVVTIHATVRFREFNQDFLRVFEWPRVKLLTPLVKLAFFMIYFLIGLFGKKIIVHSLGLKETLTKDYFCDPQKIEVVPHGVPEDVSYQLSAVSLPLKERVEGKKYILYFGYFHRRKGLDVLLRAFKSVNRQHPDLFLVLGGGTILPRYAQELQGLVVELGIDSRVIFTGFLKLADLRFLLDSCLFVVLPAIYSIAASGPLAQVFAHEKAVVVSDLGVFREEIENGVNGLLAKVGDDWDLADKIEQLLTNENLKAIIVEQVRLTKNERAWSQIAQKTLDLYRSL